METPLPPARASLRIALIYGAGVWCAIWFDCWDWRWALAVLIGFLAAFLIAKRARLTRLARWMLWVVWFLVAWGMTDVRRYDATSERLADLQGNARETVELQGRIAGHPVFYPGTARSSGTAAQKGSWWFDLDVSHIRRLPEWQPARGHVRVFLTGEKDLQIQRGSLWRIAGVLTDNVRLHMERRQWEICQPITAWQLPVHPSANPPPRPSVALKMRRYTLRADPQASCMTTAAVWHPGAWFQSWRQRAGELLGRGLDNHPDIAAILRALILGYDEELSADLRRRFISTGTFHLFAVSGTHMALLAGLTAGVLRLAGVSRIYWFLTVAPVLAFFTVMVGAPASAIRGSLMSALYLLGPLIGRRSDGVSALALSGWLILLCAPDQLFAPGFILSFMTVAGLIFVVPVFTRGMFIVPPLDPLRERWRSWIFHCKRACVFSLAASVAAWLASIPLTVYWFNICSLFSVLANLPIILLVSISMGLGFLALLLGGIFPAAATVCNWLNIVPVSLMRDWLGFVESIPGCQLILKSPPVWTICAWYAGLGLLVWRLNKRRLARYKRPSADTAAILTNNFPSEAAASVSLVRQRRWWDWRLASALALIAVWPVWNFADGCGGRVQILNAGGTPVVLGRGPGYVRHAVWLANAGGWRQMRQLKQMLAQAGVSRPDLWILSGMDAGHVNAARSLAESGEFKTAHTVYPVGGSRYRVFADIRQNLAQTGSDFTEVCQAVSGELPGGVNWQAEPDANTSGRMTVETSWADWAVTIMPSDNDQSRSKVVIAPRNLNESSGAGGRLIVECAPHGFGPQFLTDNTDRRLMLAPRQILTLDFNKHRMRARWHDNQD